jgi:hypothetical protein
MGSNTLLLLVIINNDSLAVCKQFNTQRNIFNEKISNILENASYKNANNKISFLFNNKSYSFSIRRLTSSFISNCLNIRKDLL